MPNNEIERIAKKCFSPPDDEGRSVAGYQAVLAALSEMRGIALKEAAEQKWFVIATGGDGSMCKLVLEENLHQEMHDAMCCCGKPWEACSTEDVVEDVRKLDDVEEWETDYPDYGKHCFLRNFEDGYLRVYRVSDAAAILARLVDPL